MVLVRPEAIHGLREEMCSIYGLVDMVSQL